MREKIKKTVINSVTSLNALLENKLPVEQDEACPLYGNLGSLDSLSLVSLIVSIEEGIESEFNTGVILADEKAMSQKNSPFATIGTMVSYIELLLKRGQPSCLVQ